MHILFINTYTVAFLQTQVIASAISNGAHVHVAHERMLVARLEALGPPGGTSGADQSGAPPFIPVRSCAERPHSALSRRRRACLPWRLAPSDQDDASRPPIRGAPSAWPLNDIIFLHRVRPQINPSGAERAGDGLNSRRTKPNTLFYYERSDIHNRSVSHCLFLRARRGVHICGYPRAIARNLRGRAVGKVW